MLNVKRKLKSRIMALFLTVVLSVTLIAPTVAGAFSDKVIADQKMLTGWSYNYEATK